MRNDKRPTVDSPDFDRWAEYLNNEWDWLTPSEKALCLSYHKQLSGKTTPSFTLIKSMSDIHEKNKDFNVAHIPATLMPMTQDFSAYLPQDILLKGDPA